MLGRALKGHEVGRTVLWYSHDTHLLKVRSIPLLIPAVPLSGLWNHWWEIYSYFLSPRGKRVLSSVSSWEGLRHSWIKHFLFFSGLEHQMWRAVWYGGLERLAGSTTCRWCGLGLSGAPFSHYLCWWALSPQQWSWHFMVLCLRVLYLDQSSFFPFSFPF